MASSFEMTRRAALYFLSASPVVLSAAPPSFAETTPRSFALTTPIHIHSIALRVNNLDMMTAFYSQIIGMDIIARTATGSTLGKDGVPLMELLARPDFQADDPSTAGLYHTAFLMPNRKELGRWLITAVMNKIPFTGFADHLVSEALYLNDPEGNGIEVYADRPHEGWSWEADGHVVMGTEQLDIDNLVNDLPRDGTLPYKAPAGFRIGHVHMRVGDTAKAQDFYIKATGLDLTALIANQSAAFFSSGHYHHHIGANIWQSRGAGKRPEKMNGLEYAAFSVAPELMDGLTKRLRDHGTDIAEKGKTIETLDPWGTTIRYIEGA